MWEAKAPANIALIKYMGKKEGNISQNVSLSYTLDKFISYVTLELCTGCDSFENQAFGSGVSLTRFLGHLQYIKRITGCSEHFKITSKNNFPHSAGIASSASSFAALTICVYKAISDIKGINMPSNEEMSSISRLASGSSCRSFFSPWCVCRHENAQKADIKIQNLIHDLILISSRPKDITTSKAHERIKTSLLFKDRPERAEIRYQNLIEALNNNKWLEAFEICWAEFLDMHALFGTSSPHFGYIKPETLTALQYIEDFWFQNNDGPLVTIDAGPNIHLLWREDEICLREKFHTLSAPYIKNFCVPKID